MGHELYRMIRDGAPASWTPAMRLVVMVIADDARPDPSQGLPPDGGWPLSKIRLHGHRADDGQWYDGLAERTGMSEHAIRRALADLARAGCEMREQIGSDKHGRPVFAYPWRARRFRVPPLPPRRWPDTATYRSSDTATYRSSDTATYRSSDTAITAEQRPQVAESDRVGGQKRPPSRSSDLATYFPIPLPVPDPPRRTPRTGSSGPAAATDDDDSGTRKADLDGHAEGAPPTASRDRPGPGYGRCPECGDWHIVGAAGGGMNRHKSTIRGRLSTCPGSRRPPAEPVPCVRCGATGVALSGYGICRACTRAAYLAAERGAGP